MPPRRTARTATPSTIRRRRWHPRTSRCRRRRCASSPEACYPARIPQEWVPVLRSEFAQRQMNLRLLMAALCALAVAIPAAAQTPDLATIARSAGTPDIPGLKMVWLAPWGDVAKAHPWRNIIVHQTEGPAGSARGGAEAQSKNPTRRGVTVWVETDGTVYWAVAENLVPTHGDGANRNDNKFIDNGPTWHQVIGASSI